MSEFEDFHTGSDIEDALAPEVEESTDAPAQQSFKRLPSRECGCGEFSKEDKRVALVGRIESIDAGEGKAVIVDESGKATLKVTESYQLDLLGKNRLYRVIGKPKQEEGSELLVEVEFVQDFEGFDVETFKRIKEVSV